MRNRAYIIVLGIFFFLNIAVWQNYDGENAGHIKVHFLDVGQGDAIFIETEDNFQILIDGGPDSSVLSELADVMPFYDKTLDLVILTHPDKDHLGGLIKVLQSYEVRNILWTGVARDTKIYSKWIELIKKEGADIKIARTGQKIILGENTILQILYPFSNYDRKKESNINNSSIVSRLIYGEESFLFTGDIEQEAEADIMANNLNIDSDLMQVPHHGSMTSSSVNFVGKASPDIAVVSVGKNNRYGHPAPEILKRYNVAEIFRTDQDGTVTIDGDGIDSTPFKVYLSN